MSARPHVTMDFEARSAADIRKCGGWMYSIHPSTEAICLAYTTDVADEPKLWAPQWAVDLVGPWYLDTYGVPVEIDCPWLITGSLPEDLARAIAAECDVEAHNAFFERSIWGNVMRPGFGWQDIHPRQWRCSAAKAAAHSLPRALGDAVEVLNLPYPKDMAGHRIMQKISRPRKARTVEKKDLISQGCTELGDGYGWRDGDKVFWLWSDHPQDIYATWEYCRQDVRAERALSQALADLAARELRVWQVDQAINLRGIRIDRKMATAALDIAAQAVDAATTTAVQAAAPAPFTSLGQRDKILQWVCSKGVHMPDMQGATIDTLLMDPELDSTVRTVLAAKRTASRTSVRKYAKMLETADPHDDRVRDVFNYHGAGTGRWSGRFLQTQNFVRGKMSDPDTMCGIIRHGSLDWLLTCYGHTCPMEALSWALRGAICSPPGRDLVVADYSGVEARGLLWFVDDQDGLQVFARPKGQPGIYREMAGSIYNVDAASIDKNTPEGAARRQIGKQAILGLGYGMGPPKFKATCDRYNIPIEVEFAEDVVKAYRTKFPLVVKGWRDLEAAAIKAVRYPQTPVSALRVTYIRKGKFLFCVLPSGRRVAYFSPKITMEPTPWGEMRPKLSYMTVDSETHKWVRTDTYGGKLMENNIQAICRDLQAHAMVLIEDNPSLPYDIVMHTHDELVAECDEGEGSVEEFEGLMSQLPVWAGGFPLRAEGWRGKRYRK
jgi:DNA polymerase